MNDVFDALAHPTRRAILEMVKEAGKTAGVLADVFPVSKPTMSAHFAKLKSAGLIQGGNRRGSIVDMLDVSALEEVVLGFMTRMGVGEEREVPRCAPAR